MPITFSCPHCGAKSKVDDHLAGQRGPCGSCGMMVTIPLAGYRSAATKKRSSFPTWLIILLVGGSLMLLSLCVCVPIIVIPGIQAAQEAAKRANCIGNMSQIGFALINYNETHGTFPPAYIPDDQGRPMHSWRVLILPYLEQQALYEQYDFDQPWNSPHNRDLLQDVDLPIYRCPSGDNPPGHTSYMVVTGPGTMFEGVQGTSYDKIMDGVSNTMMVIEVPHSNVHWAKPTDISATELIAQFGDGSFIEKSDHTRGVVSVFVDGSVHFLRDSIPLEIVKGLTTQAGGESFRYDAF